ncbi:ribonuclease R [Candidatus Gracilibacteria bacterium]|nr:ribonuclease R [Candidatus Gracilibacteria bacterium]NUJ98454.1 ribonuclease R [Candidatus Gracilibacteria bacterium]
MQHTGIYREGKGDYGFVDEEIKGKKKGYYVHYNNKKNALDGDEVSFIVKIFKGKEEAEIEEIIKREKRVLVGKLQRTKNGYGFVVFENNPFFKQDIFIKEKNLLNALDGEKVAVLVDTWKGKNPEGKIIERLGTEESTKVDIISIAFEGGARVKFPIRVLDEAKDILKIGELKENKRINLTNLFTFTIDGEDAKDLDDAISLKKLDNGNFKLFVHIADVAHYVKEKSFLDEEALKRATSIYLVDRVIPMLPSEISNGVCSLNPHEKKLTLTCEMDIDKHGKTIATRVYESIIQSDFRLSYKQVEKIRENNFQDKELGEILKEAYILKEIIANYRKKNGYLSFDFDEVFIEVDEKGNPINIKKYEKFESHKVIEHFMINANEAIAKKFSTFPFLYRVHPDPQREDIENMIKQLSNYISLDKNDTSIEKVIQKAEGNNFLSRLILRSLPKAIYSAKNEGHFGLGLEFYSHFTSPIRRYPDLQIHRIIKEKLAGNLSPSRIIHYKNILDQVADTSSEKERQAEKIERRVNDLMKIKYMEDKIGQVFMGKISGMIPKGFFVELENTVEGFVDILNLDTKKTKKSSWEFIENALMFKNTFSGEVFKFGDSVKIKLISVDTKLLRLDFKLMRE